MTDKIDISELDASALRKFGLTLAVAVVAFFGLAIPWIFDLQYRLWPWVLAGIFGAWAVVAPTSMGWFYMFWMQLGLVLNRVVSPVVLGIVYFVLFAPLGFLMRLFGHRPMNDHMDPELESYRIESPHRDTDHIEKPF